MEHRTLRRRLFTAALLAGVLPASSAVQAQGAPPLGERIQLCAGCHAPDGNSVIPDNPKLSGLDADYIVRQLADFKSGKRKNPVMGGIVPMVEDAEFKELAHHFSSQKRKASEAAADAKLVAQGKEIFNEGIAGSAVPACSGCHNEDGSGSDKYPRIAGQNVPYVINQLANFKNGERANDSRAVMQAVAKRMNEAQIRAVAEYVATLTEGDQ